MFEKDLISYEENDILLIMIEDLFAKENLQDISIDRFHAQ